MWKRVLILWLCLLGILIGFVDCQEGEQEEDKGDEKEQGDEKEEGGEEKEQGGEKEEGDENKEAAKEGDVEKPAAEGAEPAPKVEQGEKGGEGAQGAQGDEKPPGQAPAGGQGNGVPPMPNLDKIDENGSSTITSDPGTPQMSSQTPPGDLSLDKLVNMQNSAIIPPPVEGSLTQKIDKDLSQGTSILEQLNWQLAQERQWARNVYEVISNYEFKYNNVLVDISDRSEKSKKLRQLVRKLKTARLHSMVKNAVTGASQTMNELAADPNAQEAYVKDMKSKLDEMQKKEEEEYKKTMEKTVTETEELMQQILSPVLPDMKAQDAASNIVSAGEKALDTEQKNGEEVLKQLDDSKE